MSVTRRGGDGRLRAVVAHLGIDGVIQRVYY
jgi:hypothetical protein